LITARYFSSCPSDSTSRWTPCPPESYPRLSGQRGITPAFGYDAPHPSARGTLTLLNNVLLSTHCGSVRLPVFFHHRRTSLDFPTRPASLPAPGGHGISRFPVEMLPYVPGVSDRGGPRSASRYRRPGCCLRLSPTAPASRRNCLTRLNTRPARSPVNASTPPSRAAPQDSGPLWVANPSTYDSFIHYTLPV
jgi:hypothetical protein